MTEDTLSPTDLVILDWFKRARDPNYVIQLSIWTYMRGKRPDVGKRIKALESQGLLRTVSPEERLGDLGVPRLKQELKARDASSGGNKVDLIERLRSLLLPGEAEALVDGPGVLCLSDTGTQVLATAIAAEMERHHRAVVESHVAVKARDLDSAHNKRSAYISSRGGIGALSPDEFPRLTPLPELRVFRCLAMARPDSLHYLTAGQFDELIAATAMQWLWDEPTDDYLSPDFPDSPLPPEVAAKHLRSAARILGETLDVAPDGSMILETGYQSTACSQCIDLVGRVFPRGSALPALPLRGCFAEEGCCLRVGSKWDDFDEDDDSNVGLVGDVVNRASGQDPVARLQQAKVLLEQGLISEHEFEGVKQAVIEQLSGA
jgi:hypothetical protein